MQSKNIANGTIVVAKYGFNTVLSKPFEFLYEFGYYNSTGGCVVYNHGEHNMQDAHAFKLNEVRVATPDEVEKFFWGN
jgi:hypothetical protein